MRLENQKMKRFLAENGVEAMPKYHWHGSLRGTWRLYNPKLSWSMEWAAKLTTLGFTDFDGKPLGQYSGNGGLFSLCVTGHDELTNGVPTIGTF